jgi:hypothetical protein
MGYVGRVMAIRIGGGLTADGFARYIEDVDARGRRATGGRSEMVRRRARFLM